MRRFFLSALALGLTTYVTAQIKIPAISPAVEISQNIGLTTISLSYSRPSLRGRELIGEDGILRFNEKWRTGANAATKLELTSDVTISDHTLPKGSYALLSTPQQDSWTLHFYPYASTSYTTYIDQDPILSVTARVERTAYATESLSIHFEAVGITDADLVLEWSDYKVSLPIRLNEHDVIMKGIDRVLEGPSSFAYFQAALYLHESQTDLPRALGYIQRATQDESAQFFMVYREALILRDLGQEEEAIAAAKRSVALSKEAGNTDLARLSQRIIDELSN